MDGVPGRTRSRVLIERARELEQIDAMLRSAIGSEGSGLLIEGPPGIGKSALLEAARLRAQQRGITTLAARGDELDGHFPYGVVRQLFEPALWRASAGARRELLSGAARWAAPVVAGEGDASLGAGDTAFAHLHGLYWLMVNLSLQAPVLITVDDAHLADAPSLRFLRYVLRRLDGMAAALVVSARSGERGFADALAARLAGEPLVRVVRPAPFSEPAVAALLAAGLGQTPDEAFTAACRSATGGTPFLVHELVAALAADRVQPTTEHAPRVQELGPRTVARATIVRLARMSGGCVALARATAVLAGEAQLPRAARLAGLNESAALQALDALVDGDVLRADTSLEFVHPIVRAAIYDELAPGERSRLHRDAARRT